jgi:hypothetical protein
MHHDGGGKCNIQLLIWNNEMYREEGNINVNRADIVLIWHEPLHFMLQHLNSILNHLWFKGFLEIKNVVLVT